MVVLSTRVETASGGVGRCSVWEALELQPPLFFLTEFPVGSRDKADRSVRVICQRVADPAARLSARGYLSGGIFLQKNKQYCNPLSLGLRLFWG